MTPADCLDDLLAQVVARIGDPAPRVYARLFDESPHVQALFVNDSRGSVRAEMFLRALDTLLDLAAGRPYAPGMIASERVTHAYHGIDAAQFDRFFHIIGDVFRDALGNDWSPVIDDTWRSLLAQVGAIHGHATA